jgi:protein gp37
MSDRSAIEWTDATWNPVRGCTKVSPGCKFCYAQVFAERFRGVPGHPSEHGFDLRLVPEKLEQPLRWKRPRKIFVNSMSDLFMKTCRPGSSPAWATSCVEPTGTSFRSSPNVTSACVNC